MNFILELLFERLPILKQLNGSKRKIGEFLQQLSALLILVQSGLLEYGVSIPLLDKSIAWIGLLLGFLVRFLGELHAKAKDAK